jgi:Fe-S-cluster containining protein
MELSEATALAGTFVTSLIFKAHSMPLSERSGRAAQWWREQESRVPLRAALEEKRRHLALFSSRRRSERRNDREVYLTISAIVDDYGNGKCPALRGRLCGIYDYRPLTCRTVPLHYSRQASVLQSYVDQFTTTPGYECNTTTSPAILSGSRIVSAELRLHRDRAVALAKADRRWKEQILSFMDNSAKAARVGLPTYEAILNNTENGYATLLPMIVGWRVAEYCGLISPADLRGLCEKTVALIESEVARSPEPAELRELLPLYRFGAAGKGTISPTMDMPARR